MQVGGKPELVIFVEKHGFLLKSPCGLEHISPKHLLAINWPSSMKNGQATIFILEVKLEKMDAFFWYLHFQYTLKKSFGSFVSSLFLAWTNTTIHTDMYTNTLGEG